MEVKDREDRFQINKLMKVAVSNADTFDDIQRGVMGVLRLASHMTPNGRLGYLSAIISSLGYERIGEMTIRLENVTAQLRENADMFGFPVFSSSDIFPPGGVMEARIKASGEKLSQDNFNKFWDSILGSGFVTDIFMTPHWELSSGAKLEYQKACDMKMVTHLYDLASKETPSSHGEGGEAEKLVLNIWNQSSDSIQDIYRQGGKRPYYLDHEEEKKADFRLLESIEYGDALRKEISGNIGFLKRCFKDALRREKANRKALTEYYRFKDKTGTR
jgi:hypothetical protein